MLNLTNSDNGVALMKEVNKISESYVELCREIERHKRMAELWQLNYELAMLILEGLYDGKSG